MVPADSSLPTTLICNAGDQEGAALPGRLQISARHDTAAQASLGGTASLPELQVWPLRNSSFGVMSTLYLSPQCPLAFSATSPDYTGMNLGCIWCATAMRIAQAMLLFNLLVQPGTRRESGVLC